MSVAAESAQAPQHPLPSAAFFAVSSISPAPLALRERCLRKRLPGLSREAQPQ
ncbi:hypothetical protein [Paraburkholderia sp.]|uniref:hypothetical protein n=1 Tax=Paraburkholderia sp. TaxID=1926495 RepID=UPI0025F8E675|nr:hypothetical protein [Paraburkholderia sp.]